MTSYDLWLMLPLLIHACASLRYAQAYWEFPKSLSRALRGVANIGPFREHLAGAKHFIQWCAASHVIDPIVMLVMILTMHLDAPWLYWLAFGVYWLTLPVKIFGGEYSHHRARRLTEDADDINDFLSIVTHRPSD